MTAERDALAELVACKDLHERWDAINPCEPGCEKEVLRDEWRKREPVAWAAARTVLAAQPDNDQTGREGNKAGTSAEQSTHGCKAPTQGESAEYLAPDPTAAPAQPDDVERWGNADTDEIGRKSGWHQRTDGYWTPWHIAADAIDALRAERDALECANASLNVEVDRLYACRNELQEVTRTMNDPTINIIHTLNEAVHSLRAERDALREALQAAAKAMNDECLYYAQYGEQPPQHLLDALDAARAKVQP